MTDSGFKLENNQHWLDLLAFIESGSVPNSIGIEVRLPWQEYTAIKLAHCILCANGTGCGECQSCRAWVENGHPDLLIAGAPGEPANVDECRVISGELSLSPVVAPVRLIVFYAPEKMSPGAVNSLLKITEEPPQKGRVLYVMDKANILATLRSRLWMLSLSVEESIEPIAPPESDSEWLLWLKENEKKDAQEWYAMLHGYAAWLCRKGDFRRASSARQLAETALSTHLSSAMWSDIIFLLLREEYPFEHVFDDFRQAALPGLGDNRRW